MKLEIERDRYGRPMVRPPKGGKAEAYTRATTIANKTTEITNISILNFALNLIHNNLNIF